MVDGFEKGSAVWQESQRRADLLNLLAVFAMATAIQDDGNLFLALDNTAKAYCARSDVLDGGVTKETLFRAALVAKDAANVEATRYDHHPPDQQTAEIEFA